MSIVDVEDTKNNHHQQRPTEAEASFNFVVVKCFNAQQNNFLLQKMP